MVIYFHISDYVPVIISLVISVLSYVITITKKTFINTEMSIVFFSHLVCRLLCGFKMIISHFWFSGMLVNVRIYTQSTPGIASDEEIPEPGFPLKLILNPDLEVLPFYFWFVFHSVYERIRTSIACYFSSPPTKCGINGI